MVVKDYYYHNRRHLFSRFPVITANDQVIKAHQKVNGSTDEVRLIRYIEVIMFDDHCEQDLELTGHVLLELGIRHNRRPVLEAIHPDLANAVVIQGWHPKSLQFLTVLWGYVVLFTNADQRLKEWFEFAKVIRGSKGWAYLVVAADFVHKSLGG
jgi:hypothetical protein